MANGPLFSIGSLHVQYYGLCMAVGIILCFAFLYFTMQKSNFNDEAIDKILIIGIGATAFGVFMAMVFQSLYNYIEKPSEGFSLGGSMTFYGGLIGGVVSFLAVWNLYIFVIAPRTKIKLLQNNMNASLTDALKIIPIGVTIAHAFGRLGCTFAGCCHGAATNEWYGMWQYIERYDNGFPAAPAVKVVPTQLFEMIFLLALGAIMAALYFKFNFKYNLSLYAIGYGVWRFVIEYARDDPRGSFIPGVTPSQLWSIVIVILGIAYIFLHKYWLSRFEKHPGNQPPVRQPKAKKKAAEAASVADVVGAESLADSLSLDDATRQDAPAPDEGAEGEVSDGGASDESKN
ncbi:MAG: prolipoprotein diacylglyceryl transferase [Roseburia sp.]|nr:prolipoprotein diacylglyceryl transferase [Roseburia sp.]